MPQDRSGPRPIPWMRGGQMRVAICVALRPHYRIGKYSGRCIPYKLWRHGTDRKWVLGDDA